jgi:hypothetical protein
MSDFRILSGLMAEEDLRDRLDCWGYRWHHTDRGWAREDQPGVAFPTLVQGVSTLGVTLIKILSGACGLDAYIAHWRIAHNPVGPVGKEIELHPWRPSGVTMLRTATIRHCVGCATCGEAVEVDPPCTDPRWCNPENPCAGLRTAREWARGHVDGMAAAVVTAPPKAPGVVGWNRRP